MTPYDKNNIFARILRGEIPCKKIYEDECSLAFYDIHPQAPIHALIIPKVTFISMDDFITSAPPELIASFFQSIGKVVQILELSEGGYRLISNHGPDSCQEVPHLHFHILGGKKLGPLILQ